MYEEYKHSFANVSLFQHSISAHLSNGQTDNNYDL